MHPDIYSPDVERRYQAAIAVEGTLLSEQMPFGCCGSGNAFLALIGPSMGGPAPGATLQPGGDNRPEGSPMRIGHHHHFNWQKARSDRWRRLSAALLGGERYVNYLTAVLNLDWGHQSNAKDVQERFLQPGFDNYVWPAIMQIRPRIVCALTNPVWQTIEPTIRKLAVASPPSLPTSILVSRQPIIFQLPNENFTSILLKAHNHPSQPFLSRKHIQMLGDACHWFSTAWPSHVGAGRTSHPAL